MKNEAEIAEIVKVVGNYAETIWNWQTSKINGKDKMYATYALALADLPANVVALAMKKLSRSSKYWPSVAEIWETCEDIVHEAQGVHEATESEAWAEVQQQTKTAWVNKTPVFSSVEIELAAKRYGWHELCMLQSNEVGIARAQFGRYYTEIMTQKKQNAEMNRLLLSATQAQKNQLAAIAQLTMKAVEAHLA